MAYKIVFGLVLTLSVFGMISSTTNIEDIDPVLQQQLRIMQLVKNSFASADDIDADACFDHYFTEQDKISKTYSVAYNLCKSTAQDARDKLNQDSASKRLETLDRGENVCNELSACERYTDGLDFFNCYSKASGQNYPVLYSISIDSSADATNLLVALNAVETEEKSCTTSARNLYVNDMAVCNTDLEACLNGAPTPTKDPEPTEPTTEEPEPTEPTTEEPEPTEPTTEEPEPTEPTTEEPEPTEPTTEEPEPTEPTTEEPEPTEPTTEEPEPTEPTTEEPEPTEPTTEEPEPTEPTTEEPEPTEPTTEEPEPTEPTTEEPEPTEPTTEEPEPTEPTTEEPEPTEPTTEEPEPTEPTTEEPEPTEPTTDEPEPTESTTEQSPEEDLSVFRDENRLSIWKILKNMKV